MERKVEKKLPAELLAILACPHCKGELKYDEKDNSLICEKCKVKYEIIEGIPNLIYEEAIPLNS